MLEVLSLATAAETVLYVPEAPTERQPGGGEVRPARGTSEEGAATAAPARDKTTVSSCSMLETNES